MILCIWLLTNPLVHMVLFLSPSPGPVLLSCALWYTPVLCCVYGSPSSLLKGRVPLIFGVMLCLALCCVWYVTGIRRFETFWCYAVLWRHRRAGDHIFCALCMICILKVNILIFWISTYFLYFRFDCDSDLFSVYSALHTQYIFVLTPFLRGLRFMPAGTDAQFGDPPV